MTVGHYKTGEGGDQLVDGRGDGEGNGDGGGSRGGDRNGSSTRADPRFTGPTITF